MNPELKLAFLTDSQISKDMSSSDPKVAGLWSAGLLLKNYDRSIPEMVKALGGMAWDPQDIELSQALVDQSHNLGLKVIPWTWPEETGGEISVQETEKLITFGVDGIITDRPDIVRGLLAARDKQVPCSCFK